MIDDDRHAFLRPLVLGDAPDHHNAGRSSAWHTTLMRYSIILTSTQQIKIFHMYIGVLLSPPPVWHTHASTALRSRAHYTPFTVTLTPLWRFKCTLKNEIFCTPRQSWVGFKQHISNWKYPHIIIIYKNSFDSFAQVLKNARKASAIISPLTGDYMNIHVWFPLLNLGFEFQVILAFWYLEDIYSFVLYQDKYHYRSTWYFHYSLSTVQERDNIQF